MVRFGAVFLLGRRTEEFFYFTRCGEARLGEAR